MPNFAISYVTCPNHAPEFCNQCAEEAYFPITRAFKVTFSTPNEVRPTSSCIITFGTLQAMIDYVTKWETDPPLYHWSVQSIEEVDDNLRAPARAALESLGII